MVQTHRETKMKALFVNGSPRKKWNTADALDHAAEGAKSVGAEVERVDLYDYECKGCMSCFACKLKNAKTNGLCAMRDALRPVLEKARAADLVVVGSPVYFHNPTGQVRAFIERFAFPVYSYFYENGAPRVARDKVVPTGLIYTMNCPKDMMEQWNYPQILGSSAETLNTVFGYNELLYIYNTTQFKDYSRYDFNLFDPEEKARYKEAHYEEDMRKAFELGKRLAEKARAIADAQA